MAAQELHITQPAISKRIHDLEHRLGAPLFWRKHRAVELTAAGNRLFKGVTAALELLYDSAGSLEPAPPRGAVVFAASTMFNTYWALPRIQDFNQLFPAVELHLRTIDRERDMDREGIDLATLYGDGNWRHVQSWRLADEIVYPVCSPTYLESCGEIRSVADLPRHKLLHLLPPHRVVTSWKEWLDHFAVKDFGLDYSLTFNDPAIVLRAAILGEGIALGWEHIVADFVADGRLVRPIAERYESERSLYLVASNTKPLNLGAQLFRDWMIETASLRRMATSEPSQAIGVD